VFSHILYIGSISWSTILKIAFCLSGQPRTWKKCYEGWYSAFSALNADIDLFFHLWDYNSMPMQAVTDNINNTAMEFEDVDLTQDEKQELINTLKPKKFQFEPEWSISDTFYAIENPIAWWAINQFKSLQKVAQLKRDYEIENNFQYDLVVRIRSDLVLNTPILVNEIESNSLYVTHIGWDKSWDCFRISDIFFWGNSYNFDQAADFVNYQRIIDASWIVNKNTNLIFPPELAFYHYLKSVGLNIKPTWPEIKIRRSDEYAAIKGRLDPYETL
jgi:hypothetical protein